MKPHHLFATIFVLISALSSAAPRTGKVLHEMKRVADWQIANPSKHHITDWTQAPFFLGLYNLQQVSQQQKYLDELISFGKRANFGPGRRVSHADDHAVLQAWLELYQLNGQMERLTPSIEHFPKIIDALKDMSPASVSGGTFTWCWCDALFMSPPAWAQLSHITGDQKYLTWADREWWTCTDVLYDPAERLYYRDNRFFGKKTKTGKKIFWSRGNGWVVGGLVHMLDYLSADHPSRDRYLALYHDMMYALLKLQNADGLWRTSLLDPQMPVGESSGSSFFVYAMAWGVNRGLLPADKFKPAVDKGWAALCGNIQPNGMLGYVQKIGDQPGASGPESTEVYGSGAFLLAGSEIIRMIDPSKRRKGLASFEGVQLPAMYVTKTPRVVVQYVPERADDFAWENDLIAFRTYGPALRDGAEDSGFDAWFKRVPYPIIAKWYIEDLTPLKHTNKSKSYHQDQGEGYDGYKVGNTRGCGGISVWANGKIHNSNTYIGYKIIEQTQHRAIFDLHYASDYQGKVLRETKRITVIMRQRLFQSESRYTLDGKPAQLDVAIGLKHQAAQKAGTQSASSFKTGILSIWEKLDGLGLGQAVVIDPASVEKTITHTDADGQTQSLCLARTDKSGYIRWFSGYGWEGQGEITNAQLWQKYLGSFAAKFTKKPFSDHSKTLKVHTLSPPVEPMAPAPTKEVPSTTLINPNGG